MHYTFESNDDLFICSYYGDLNEVILRESILMLDRTTDRRTITSGIIDFSEVTGVDLDKTSTEHAVMHDLGYSNNVNHRMRFAFIYGEEKMFKWLSDYKMLLQGKSTSLEAEIFSDIREALLWLKVDGAKVAGLI